MLAVGWRKGGMDDRLVRTLYMKTHLFTQVHIMEKGFWEEKDNWEGIIGR